MSAGTRAPGDGPAADTATRLRAALERMLHYRTMSNALRVVGAGVVTASLSVFLFQGWESGNDVGRYLLLLAQTGLLAGAGLVTAHVLREYKGARLFLALSLVSVAVNFTVLGALVYSQVQWDALLGTYPSFAVWQAPSLAAALGTTGLALAALAPVTWLGFRALARPQAGRLTALYVAGAATLLLPVREALPIALLSSLGCASLLWLGARMAAADVSLRTPGGVFSRAVLLLPAAVMMGRGIYLYAGDELTFTVLAATVFWTLRQVSLALPARSVVRRALESVSLVPALAVAGGLAAVLESGLGLAPSLWLPLPALVFAALAVEISLRAAGGARAYRHLAAVSAALGLGGNLLLCPGVVAAGLAMAAGVLMVVAGHRERERLHVVLGALTALGGVAWQVLRALEVFDLGGWASLALVGVAIIVVASTLERRARA